MFQIGLLMLSSLMVLVLKMIEFTKSCVGLKVDARFCFCVFLLEQLKLVIMNGVSLTCDVSCLEWCIQHSFLEKNLAQAVLEDECFVAVHKPQGFSSLATPRTCFVRTHGQQLQQPMKTFHFVPKTTSFRLMRSLNYKFATVP